MADKKRFDYSLIGLEKKNGITLFNGIGIADMESHVVELLANYGLFVMLSRSLAGHKKDSVEEKKDTVYKVFDWLMDGCPKREKSKADVFTTTCNKVMASDATDEAKEATIAALELAFNRKFE